MKRILLSLALVSCIILCSSVRSEACNKTFGCYATAETVTCGTPHGEHAYSHYVAEPNGYGYYCEVSRVSSVHSITCMGCGVYLRSEVRTCRMEHADCGMIENYMCQY